MRVAEDQGGPLHRFFLMCVQKGQKTSETIGLYFPQFSSPTPKPS
jgi:hypothetical protein